MDLHYFGKLDLDPHEKQNLGFFEAQNEAVVSRGRSQMERWSRGGPNGAM
jgi:hypothetical protein